MSVPKDRRHISPEGAVFELVWTCCAVRTATYPTALVSPLGRMATVSKSRAPWALGASWPGHTSRRLRSSPTGCFPRLHPPTTMAGSNERGSASPRCVFARDRVGTSSSRHAPSPGRTFDSWAPPRRSQSDTRRASVPEALPLDRESLMVHFVMTRRPLRHRDSFPQLRRLQDMMTPSDPSGFAGLSPAVSLSSQNPQSQRHHVPHGPRSRPP